MKGETIYEDILNGSHKYSFDLSARPPGIYFVRVVMDGMVLSGKIVKQ